MARPKDTHKSRASIMDRGRETTTERKRRRKGGFLYNFDSHEQRSTFVSSGKPPGVQPFVVVVHLAAPACLQRVAHVVPSFLGCPTSTSLIHRRHELADDDVTAAAWRARQNVDGLQSVSASSHEVAKCPSISIVCFDRIRHKHDCCTGGC